MKILLGCGKTKKDGYTGVDIIPPADILCDVTLGLPMADNSVERIEADNLFEHFDNDGFMVSLNECWRVLKKGGTLFLKVPDSLHWPDGAFGDPTHKRYFVPRSFRYFTE